jgi:hypothetical protein
VAGVVQEQLTEAAEAASSLEYSKTAAVHLLYRYKGPRWARILKISTIWLIFTSQVKMFKCSSI